MKLTDKLYQAHLTKKRSLNWQVRSVQGLLLLSFLIGWEWAGRMKWIDVLLFSYPSKIMNLLGQKIADGSIFSHIGVTVLETIAGFVLGTLIGTAFAALLWWFPFVSRVADPYIVVLNSLPKVALGPLFIVGLGPGLMSIIATTLSITVMITTLVVYGSFKEADPNMVKVVQLFGGTRSQSFRMVILPASIPAIVSTLKVNVGLSWVGVIVGEFLVSQAGLGYLIIYGFQVFNFTLVLGSLFIIAVVATAMYQAVVMFEARIIKKSS
jgi:NitT/TauT family transport system permease protein